VSATGVTLLPPPTFRPEVCAAGGDGLEGCRACVTACPQGALSARPGPTGTEIAVDDTACVRCGACTAVCPTSSLERAFLPDDELRRRVAASVVPARPLLIIGEHHDHEMARAAAAGWGVVAVPSVLIVDTTSLVTAHLAGASAIAVAGCGECHRDALHLIEAAAETAGALAGRAGASLVAVVGTEGFSEALFDLEARTSTQTTRLTPASVDLPPPGAARRAALDHLLGANTHDTTTVHASLPGFGHVTVDDDGCTLCGACTRACPTGAVAFDPGAGELSTRDLDCVSCGMCVAACPEQALHLEPAPAATVLDRRVLVSDEMVPCSGCGAPHLPARLLDHARRVVAASGRPPTRASRQLDRCPACRSVDSDGLRVRPSGPVDPVGVPRPDRRTFLAGSAAATVGGVLGMIATGADPAAAAPAARDDVEPGRLGMVIDLRRCIGCHACTAVCKAENHVPLGVYRDWVEEYVVGEYPDARPTFVPKLCNHCTDPGCLRACPTGAIFKRADGIVDLDHDMCIGCRACNQACPYGATFVDPVRNTADKCNLCAHRVDEGLRPACVDVCPSQCRVFGDLDDPDSAPRRLMDEQATTVLRPELGLGPNVRYVGMPTDLGQPATATTTVGEGEA
jgi:tetrathionate reductase subunit B